MLGILGVDVFVFDWKLYNFWIVLFVYLIVDIIRYLELCIV